MDDDRTRLVDELKRAFARATTPKPDVRRESPMSFTAELLAAIVAGRKTETRRPIRPPPANLREAVPPVDAGDRLWVREAYARGAAGFEYARGGRLPAGVARWTPARFMPREAARLFLPVIDVRATRLSEIDEPAALAEGFLPAPLGNVSARSAFLGTWDTFYGATEFAAAADPWVWAIRFRVE